RYYSGPETPGEGEGRLLPDARREALDVATPHALRSLVAHDVLLARIGRPIRTDAARRPVCQVVDRVGAARGACGCRAQVVGRAVQIRVRGDIRRLLPLVDRPLLLR